MQSRPSILFVLNSLAFGGAEKQVVSLLNQLPTEHFRLSLVCIKNDPTLLAQLDTGRLQMVQSLDVTRGLNWKAVTALARLYESLEADIVVCTNPYAGLYGFLSSLLSAHPVKLVEVFHTTMLFTFKENLQMPLYWILFRSMDLLVYVSELQRQYWRRRGLRSHAEITIHNGIDVNHFTDNYTGAAKAQLRETFGFDATDYVIGICAALRPEKAHGILLQALATLRTRGHSNAKLMIIGDGPERQTIESGIARLGLGANVAITGFQRDVRPYIASCDVTTLPSYAVETFSIAALEAMSLGKPVILSNIGGAAEQVSDGINGYLIPPNDVEGLIQALHLLADPGRRKRMAIAARERVESRFAIDRMIASFAENLLALLPPVAKQ